LENLKWVVSLAATVLGVWCRAGFGQVKQYNALASFDEGFGAKRLKFTNFATKFCLTFAPVVLILLN